MIVIIIIIIIIIIQKIIGYPSQTPRVLRKLLPSSMDWRTSLQVSGLTHDFKWGGCGVFPLTKSLFFGKSEDGLDSPALPVQIITEALASQRKYVKKIISLITQMNCNTPFRALHIKTFLEDAHSQMKEGGDPPPSPSHSNPQVWFCHVKGADLLLICSIAAYVIFFAYIVLIFLENP